MFAGDGSFLITKLFRVNQGYGSTLGRVSRGKSHVMPIQPILQVGSVPDIQGLVRAAEDVDVVFL